MKKFSFFPVLLVALFMVMGFGAQAQDYVPVEKARALVQSTVTDLQNSASSLTQKASTNGKAVLVESLKVSFGEAMLKPLENGSRVDDAFSVALSNISSNVPSRSAAIAEVETFYRNLLQKK